MGNSASSSSKPITRHSVYLSFHAPDLPKGFINHLHDHFASKGMTTFKDQGVGRGQTIGPEFVKAIRGSRVSVVVLSKSYASSSLCLDVLVEIFKCQEDEGQMIVFPVYYQIDRTDVKKQTGDFGIALERTCKGKTKEMKLRWSKALAHVTYLAGEDFQIWFVLFPLLSCF